MNVPLAGGRKVPRTNPLPEVPQQLADQVPLIDRPCWAAKGVEEAWQEVGDSPV